MQTFTGEGKIIFISDKEMWQSTLKPGLQRGPFKMSVYSRGTQN